MMSLPQAAKEAHERTNKTMPNYKELRRNFRYAFTISSQQEYLEICDWAEGIEPGSSDPKPLGKINSLKVHVSKGFRVIGPKFRSRCVAWIRDGMADDHLAFFEARFGDLTDLKLVDDARSKMEEKWESDRLAALERGKRPEFDVHEGISYRYAGIGNLAITVEHPVLVLTGMAVKPSELVKLGASTVKTWRESLQRAAFFDTEKAAFEAINVLHKDVKTVCRFTRNGKDVLHIFNLWGLDNNLIERYSLEPLEKHSALYVADDVNSTLLAIARPDLTITLHRPDRP